MRILLPVLFIALCILPIGAVVWNKVYFPDKIQQNLNQSAQSGDITVVQEEASRLSALYPVYEEKIASYVKNVVGPATRVMAVANDMVKNKSEQTAEKNNILSQDLNNLDIGSDAVASQ